jgi:hypothetical protein
VIPSPWPFALLVLAAYRVWRLLAEDTILDRPRLRLYRAAGWNPESGDDPPPGYRAKLALFISCPWCAGFWVSVAVWACWSWQPHWTLVVSAPFALNGVVGLVAKNLDG